MYGAALIAVHSLIQHLEITRARRSATSQNFSGVRSGPERASPQKEIEEGDAPRGAGSWNSRRPSPADDYISMFSGL